MSPTGKTSLTVIRGLEAAPKSVPRSRSDTIVLRAEVLDRWKVPPFQRPLVVTGKVREIAEEMKTNGGVIKGVLTLGVYRGETYLCDGQHRVEAFRLSGLDEGYADVRIIDFDSLTDMAEEFAELNSSIRTMQPDDRLRALAVGCKPLQVILEGCPFVGFGSVRRTSSSSPILSMSVVLRMWVGSAVETPASATRGAAELAKSLTVDEAERIVDFLSVVMEAWGRDIEYYRLWGALNLTLMAWLWRRVVTGQYKSATTRITKAQFSRCAMAVSASGQYIDWLAGRKLGDRDRSPAYQRLRQIFVRRLGEDGVTGVRFPSPPWSSANGKVVPT